MCVGGRHELIPGLVGRHLPGLARPGQLCPARGYQSDQQQPHPSPAMQSWRAWCGLGAGWVQAGAGWCRLLTSAPRSVLPSRVRAAVLWRPNCQPACTSRINVIKMPPQDAISPASALCHPPCLPRCQLPAASRPLPLPLLLLLLLLLLPPPPPSPTRIRRQRHCLNQKEKRGTAKALVARQHKATHLMAPRHTMS